MPFINERIKNMDTKMQALEVIKTTSLWEK